jgi:hypothetical protein
LYDQYQRLGMRPTEIYSELEKRHAAIGHHISSGAGLGLMYLDSYILSQVLSDLVARRIPALPVHDSLVSKISDADAVEEAMLRRYKEKMGFPIQVKRTLGEAPGDWAATEVNTSWDLTAALLHVRGLAAHWSGAAASDLMARLDAMLVRRQSRRPRIFVPCGAGQRASYEPSDSVLQQFLAEREPLEQYLGRNAIAVHGLDERLRVHRLLALCRIIEGEDPVMDFAEWVPAHPSSCAEREPRAAYTRP